MTEPSAPDPDAPDDGPGTCASCGAPLAPEQDWCLACGTASPSRIGELPGLKTAAKVAALTLVLVGLAVGASYAALSHGGKSIVIASLPAPAPTTPAAPTDTTPATTPPTTKTHETTSSPPPVESTPTVPPDDSSDDFPADTTDASTPDTTDTSTPDTTTTTSTPRSTTPTKTTPTTTKPKSTKIKLAKNAVSIYDPQTRVVSHTDAVAATDGDPSTLLTINTIPSTDGVQAGFLIDLGAVKHVTRIHLQTPTPGFGAGVYGATGPDIPKTLTDPNWKHLRNGVDVASADGTATLTLGKKGKGVSYRYLLIWVTNPPPAQPGARDVPATGTDATASTPAPAPDPTTTTATTATTPPPTVAATTVPPPTTPAIGASVSIAELSVFS